MKKSSAFPATLTVTNMDEAFAMFGPLLTRPVRRRRRSEIRVDLTPVTFVDPFGMVCLWATLQRLCRHFCRVVILLPRCGDVQGYLARMGFWALTDMPEVRFEGAIVEPGEYRPDANFLLELTPIVRGNAGSVAEITRTVLDRTAVILRDQLGYTEREITNVATVLTEACQNVQDHSGCDGVAAVQRYTNARTGRRYVVIAVADCGHGINKTLSERYKNLHGSDHRTAIGMALQKQYSRLPERGLGLYHIRQIAEGSRSSLHLRSGDARLHLSDRPRFYDSCHFPGTQICIALNERL